MPSTHMEKSVPWSRFMPLKKYWLAFPSPLCWVATIPGNISASSPILKIGRVLKSARATKPSDEEDAIPTSLVALPYTIVSSRCPCSSLDEYFASPDTKGESRVKKMKMILIKASEKSLLGLPIIRDFLG